MPLITTHNYFANDVFKNAKKEVTDQFIDKRNIFELFAQGFDLLQFYEFFNLKKEKLQEFCHENYTDIYFLNIIKNIKKEKLTKDPEVLASLYGHLAHYILDSNCHPFIFYKTGAYNPKNPETKKYLGLHTHMEMQIDAYLYETRNNKMFKHFKIHKNLITKERLSKTLIELLNTTYKQTFNIDNGGNKYQKGKKIMYYSYKFLIEDPTGIKTKLYKFVDLLTPKKGEIFEYYSSHIKKVDLKIFNNEHNTWYHPWLEDKTSNESFFDLYNKALNECTILFEKTDQFINNKIDEIEYKKYLKDYSYVTGLSWRQKETLKHLEF